MYEKGEGGAKDTEKAKRLIKEAKELGADVDFVDSTTAKVADTAASIFVPGYNTAKTGYNVAKSILNFFKG